MNYCKQCRKMGVGGGGEDPVICLGPCSLHRKGKFSGSWICLGPGDGAEKELRN